MNQIPRPPRPLPRRSAASVALETWLAERAITQTSLAEDLGLLRALVNAYVRGVRVPKLDAAERLERITGGAVRVLDWREAAAVKDEDRPGTEGERPSAPTRVTPRRKARALLETTTARLQKKMQSKTKPKNPSKSRRRTPPGKPLGSH